MKLDRNDNPNGKGKYALVKLREIRSNPKTKPALARAISKNPDCLDLGVRHSDGEFFVIRLKDKYAAAALEAYANAAQYDDEEYAGQVYMLAERAKRHPARKIPD